MEKMLEAKMQKRIEKLSRRFEHVKIDLGPIPDPVFDEQTNALLSQTGVALKPQENVKAAPKAVSEPEKVAPAAAKKPAQPKEEENIEELEDFLDDLL
jgi:hypothetical protein